MNKIHATPLPAAPILSVLMVLAHVYLTIKVIRTAVVVPNAYLVQIVPKQKLALETNVSILALESVVKMHDAML